MTEPRFMVVHVTDGNTFVLYAQSRSRAAALRRRETLLHENPNRSLRVIERTGDREYRDVTESESK